LLYLIPLKERKESEIFCSSSPNSRAVGFQLGEGNRKKHTRNKKGDKNSLWKRGRGNDKFDN